MKIKQLIFKVMPTLLIVTGTLLAGFWFLTLAQSGSSVSNTSSTFYSPIPPVGAPQIRLTKAVNDSHPAVGDEIIYTLTYENLAAGTEAFNVRLYEFLPPGTQYLSAVPSPSSYKNGTLVFDRASIGPTTAPVEVTVRVRVLEGYRQLHNYSLVMADGVIPPQVVLRTDVTQSASSLRLVKTGYSFVLINDELVYTLMVQNTGSFRVDNVTLLDVLPTGLPFVDASPPPDDVTLPLLTWSLGSMEPRERRTVVITTTAPAYEGVITNTALADASQKVVTPTLFATQVISQGAILRVSKGGSAPIVSVGDELIYTLRYENAGNETATSVVLTDTFPAGISVIGVSATADLLTDAQGVWTPGTLNPDEVGQIVITTTVGGAGGRTLLNVADITGHPGSFPEYAELETDVRLRSIYLPVIMRQ